MERAAETPSPVPPVATAATASLSVLWERCSDTLQAMYASAPHGLHISATLKAPASASAEGAGTSYSLHALHINRQLH